MYTRTMYLRLLWKYGSDCCNESIHAATVTLLPFPRLLLTSADFRDEDVVYGSIDQPGKVTL